MTCKKFLTSFACALVPGKGKGGDPRTAAECRHGFEFDSVISYKLWTVV